MYGEWWYNSVHLFWIGLLFARHEEVIVQKIKKRYVWYVILAIISLTGFYLLSVYTQEILSQLGTNLAYGIRRWISLLSQMAACCSFVFVIFLLGMKVRIGNKALAFMGAITLEFYLIHGLFVQLFGFSFMDNQVDPLYYIRNVALYVLTVLVLSIPSALLLKRFHNWITNMMVKYKTLIAVFKRDMKRVGLILLVLITAVTLIVTGISHKNRSDTKETVNTYRENNITYADVDGKKMAAYITGEGEHTIVLLCALFDPCPTITLKPIADELGEKNRVIILDYLGRGFSDATDKERTADNFVYEIHTALKSLGQEGPYIMMPHQVSGIYAQLYANTYPKEVEAVIGLDSSVAAELDETLEMEGITPDEYQRRMRKEAKLQYLKQRFLSFTGFATMEWNLYEPLLDFKHTRDEFDIVQEMFMDKFYSKNVVDEMAHDYSNFSTVLNDKYPKDLPVLFILSYSSTSNQESMGSDWKQLHEDLLTNTAIQRIKVLNGSTYFVYTKSHYIAEAAQEFIDDLDYLPLRK